MYAAGGLDRAVAEIERPLGVRASSGGRHPTWATRNAMAALGQRCYLEIITAIPDHTLSSGERPFRLDRRGPSRLVGWAANGSGLEELRDAAAEHGVVLGTVLSGDRRRADGTVLRWTLTDLRCVVADGIVPFFIDWGGSPHPAPVASQGATLVGLRAEHPDVDRVREMLRELALDLPVARPGRHRRSNSVPETGPFPDAESPLVCQLRKHP